MLGRREPEVYGKATLGEIDGEIKRAAADLGMTAETFQSNHEGEIVEKIHEAMEGFGAVIINPAAYTHTSVAIRDALLMLDIPIIEVHLSNIHEREPFRQESLIADVVTGQVVGFGKNGYILAVKAVSKLSSSASGSEQEA
jgi:3-dehydroquinate dehydratase-2